MINYSRFSRYEIDVYKRQWQYIAAEQIEIPSLYFSHKRKVFKRDGTILAKAGFIQLMEDEIIEEKTIRFRTIGDITCTGAVQSEASTLEDIIQEVASARVTERGGRADDKRCLLYTSYPDIKGN